MKRAALRKAGEGPLLRYNVDPATYHPDPWIDDANELARDVDYFARDYGDVLREINDGASSVLQGIRENGNLRGIANYGKWMDAVNGLPDEFNDALDAQAALRNHWTSLAGLPPLPLSHPIGMVEGQPVLRTPKLMRQQVWADSGQLVPPKPNPANPNLPLSTYRPGAGIKPSDELDAWTASQYNKRMNSGVPVKLKLTNPSPKHVKKKSRI